MSKKDVRRLYESFRPDNYQLTLTPDRDASVFSGKVIITGQKVQRPSHRLTFHQNGLKITRAKVTRHDRKGDQEIVVERINPHKSYDEVRLHTEQLLYPGNYTVEMEFEGQITRPMNGIYPCFFQYDDKEHQLVATQFESHHAREAFPCIDEPEAKATFDLTLTTPADETVLANTPAKKQVKNDGQLVTTFETTPKMSTYLLAFVYGDLDYREAKAGDGTVIRTYATPDNAKFTEFALDVAVKCLDFYTEYFGIPYPLEKCDLVALPDFASGAMENWGLITYREQALLVDPKNTSVANKQWVAMVVAHELAHQWFGNLVTMRWWTDLWLNEGFASWIEYLALAHLFPEWEMWTQFAVDEQQRAFKLDALEHTHPIEVPVHHPDEIRTIFDSISYNKGASVIHMLHQYLTPEIFRDGLRHYLKRHAYGNTDTVDLWQALEEVSGKPVKDFMHTWTSNPGFPMVRADVESGQIKLAQERFYINPEHDAKTGDTWPVALLTGQVSTPELLSEKQSVLKVEDMGKFMLNRGRSGFYRSTYNSEHLERLGQLVRNDELAPQDRLGLLSDVFEGAKAGKSKTIDALKFLDNYGTEDNSAVWDIIASAVASTRAVMDDEDLREAMKPFIRKLAKEQVDRLGWESKKDESHFDQLLRPTVLGLAASADEPAIVEECLKKFDAMKGPEDIAPDLRGVIYHTVVRKRNDAKTFDKLMSMHDASKNSEERLVLTAALTSFKEPALIKRALSTIKTDAIRLQDVAYWVVYSFQNRHAKNMTWQWLVKEWDWLENNLGSDLSFSRFPIYAASAFSDRAFLNKYDKFFAPRTSPSLKRSIDQGREIITWQSAWKARDFDSVKVFFNNE